MGKDRLGELLEKSEFKDWEDKFTQNHEFKTLHNQKQILQDLEQFAEISSWICDLQQNILDIEVNLFGEVDDDGSIKASQRLDENADLCFKIFSAVKRLQEDLDKLSHQQQQQQDDDNATEENLVNLVRSTQFESIKTAYIVAFWKYSAVVRRYEDKVERSSLVVSSLDDLATQPPCNDASDPMLQLQDEQENTEHRRHSLNNQTLQTFATLDETRDTVDAAESRHQELLSLEHSLLDMRNLFVLFSTLVMDHGNILNLAEGNVQAASEHVAKAAQDVKEARQYYFRATKRKWLCFSMTSCMLVVLVMLIAIAIYMAVKKFLF